MQKPHCSPWHSRTPAAPGACRPAAEPLDGGDLGTVRLTANIRQERTGWPSTSTVQAPQTPCSQPDVGAGQPQVVAQEVGQQPPRRHLHLAYCTR